MSYCSPADVQNHLISVDLSDFQTHLETQGTPFRQWLEDYVIPAAEDTVREITKRPFPTLDDHLLWVRGDGSSTLLVPKGVLPIRDLTSVTIYVTPGVKYFEFTADLGDFAYQETTDVDGDDVREQSTPTEFEDAVVAVNCVGGWLELMPGLLKIGERAAVAAYNWCWLRADFSNICLLGDFGYETVPSAVRHATARFAAATVLAGHGDYESGGMSSWSLGDESRAWARGSGAGDIGGPHGPLINQIVTEARAALKPYSGGGVSG